MSEVTQILGQIEAGDGQAAEKLLPLVCDELRKLVAAKMTQQQPGQTLQATACFTRRMSRDGSRTAAGGLCVLEQIPDASARGGSSRRCIRR